MDKKHLLKLLDWSKEDIIETLDLADKLKYETKNNIEHHILKGKTLAMIFSKSSTRTRVSFQTGIYQLGGMGMFLSTNDLQLGRGEPIKDTARVLSRYVDGIMIRTYKQSDVEDLAKYGSIPIINGLTDSFHPCQVLADLQTIREFKGSFENKKLTFVGDGGNNMCNSLIVGSLKVGMNVSIATPEKYQVNQEIIDWAKNNGNLKITSDINEAVKDSDIIYTDVWASMGMEDEKQQRLIDFKDYCVDSSLMKKAKPDAMVLHCLPAHRGEEITDEILELHSKEIFEEAENRLHAQKAVMALLMK